MNALDVITVVNGVVDLAAVAAAWNLIRSGRVRLSSPTVAQLQADGQQAPGETAAVPLPQIHGERGVA